MKDPLRFSWPKRLRSSEEGFTLIELMIASTLLGLLCFLIAQQSSIILKSQNTIATRMSMEQLSRRISESIDCGLTLKNAGIGYSSKGCSATSLEQDGAVFFNPYKSTRWGSKPLFAGPQASDGSFVFGVHKVRISCSADEGTFIVQAVSQSGVDQGGKEWRETLPNGRPKALVIGAAINKKLCYNKNNAGQISRAHVSGGSSSPFPGSPRAAFSSTGNKGVTCNQSQGWNLVSCYAGDNNISAVPNGCAPRGGIGTIVCMKAN